MKDRVKILVVDDEILIADYIYNLLEDEGYSSIRIANDENEAKLAMEEFLPDIILMDINIGSNISGIELGKLKKSNAHLIYVTAQHDQSTIKKALESAPSTYLTKPIKKQELIEAVKMVLLKIK